MREPILNEMLPITRLKQPLSLSAWHILSPVYLSLDLKEVGLIIQTQLNEVVSLERDDELKKLKFIV